MIQKILILVLLSVTLFGGTLRILNIPTYSSIKIDDKEYFNETKRFIDIKLKEKIFSYDISISNKNFQTYSFSQSISDNKVAVHTPHMQYTKEYYTNMFIEKIDGSLDGCREFKCIVENSFQVNENTYRFKDNLEDTTVDFTVSKDGYYDETDSYDITKNQKIVIEPVSSFGYIGIGFVSGNYPASEHLGLTVGDDRISYKFEDISLSGGEIYYKKNTPINLFIGLNFTYLKSKESFEESSYDNFGTYSEYSGDPLITMMSLGLSVGYKWDSLLMEIGMRQQNFEISKTYQDVTYSTTSDEVTPFISLNFIFFTYFAIGVTVSNVMVEDVESELATASLQLVF